MSALPKHIDAAANDATVPPVARPIQITTSRFVTIELAEALTGLSASAIRTKIHRGVWLEGRQWVKRDGRVFIDLEGYEQWVESGAG